MINARTLLVPIAIGMFCPGLQACNELQAEAAWVRLPPPGHQHAAGYAMLRNAGASTVRIVGITSPDFETAHVHETIYRDGQALMRPVDTIELEPGAVFEARPGGRHLMFGGPARELTGTSNVTIVFACAGGGSFALSAPVLRRAPD